MDFGLKKRWARKPFIKDTNESLVWETSAQAKWSPDDSKSIWISAGVITQLMVMKEPCERNCKTFSPFFPFWAKVEPLHCLRSTFQRKEGFDRRHTWHWDGKNYLLPSVISTLILSWGYLLSLTISTLALNPLPVTSSTVTGLSCKSLLYGAEMGTITHPYKLKTALVSSLPLHTWSSLMLGLGLVETNITTLFEISPFQRS